MFLPVSLEAPLEVVLLYGRASSSGTIALEGQFKGWVLRNFLTPEEIAFSEISVYRGRSHHNRVFLEGDGDAIGEGTCQRHCEVDSIVLLYAELGKCFFHIYNVKTGAVYREVVCNDCHILEDTDLAFSENNVVRERFEVSSSVI